MIRLAINGCCGKMGQRIINLAQAEAEFKISVALERKGHAQVGTKINNILVTDEVGQVKKADVIIDFTQGLATQVILDAALKHKKAIVIGTTGLEPALIKKIETASSLIPVVFSPNMSVGVNLLFRLVKEAALKLKNYRINITEAHHVHKKDAPSGTAKKLAQIIEEQIKQEVKDIKSIREGEIVGDHEVRFESELDTLTLAHHAKTRDIFVRGALEAARWVSKQSAGLYSMQDVLG